MDIQYQPLFLKKFRQLTHTDKKAVRDVIDFFKDHPDDPSLRNHALEAPMIGKRSITVRDDLRIIFVERGNYIQVLMLDVGNHMSVYER
jgi:mRNA-degrading endonuclease YafQ of YafQ-DinJ toxin-antitoxin module